MKEVKSLHRVKYSDLTSLLEVLVTHAIRGLDLDEDCDDITVAEFVEWLNYQKGSVTLTKWSEEK